MDKNTVIRIMYYDEQLGWVVDTVEASENDEQEDSIVLNENESSIHYAHA